MMKLLTPLGLLGLLAIAVLIIIYIIKPNYQQRRVSSTYIWKLSLRYKKKRIPINKLRNILIIICQVLILTSCAFILAQPNKVLKEQIDQTEVIAIIDSSASMLTQIEDETRFERAVDSVLKDLNVLSQDVLISVIIADTKPYFLVERIKSENKTQLLEAMQALINNEILCSFGSADMEGAILLCENILKDNPLAQISVYTDTTYIHVPERVKIVPIWDEYEWNAAILNARAEFDEGYYVFYVDIACYGRSEKITLNMEVHNANADDNSSEGWNIPFETTSEYSQGIVKTVIFKYFKEGEEPPVLSDDDQTEYYMITDTDRVFSYQSIHLWLDAEDSFAEDNSFDIYGGQKEVIKVQYYTNKANTFINSILLVLQNAYKSRWDVQIVEVKSGQPKLEGFDFYIFEHKMPEKLPTDGIVFLINPDIAPSGSDIRISSSPVNLGRDVYLAEGELHPITSNMTADNITVSQYVRITSHDPSYQVLMTCNDDPVLLVKDDEESKIVIMSFSWHYSNLSVVMEFPILMYNMFEHFLPPTVIGNSFEVFERISLKARGPQLNASNMSGYEFEQQFTSFPATFITSMPGTYLLKQTTFFNKTISEYIYVKIPAVESDIWKVEDSFPPPYTVTGNTDYFKDLLIYIAAALVAILFIEWLLHSREENV